MMYNGLECLEKTNKVTNIIQKESDIWKFHELIDQWPNLL